VPELIDQLAAEVNKLKLARAAEQESAMRLPSASTKPRTAWQNEMNRRQEERRVARYEAAQAAYAAAAKQAERDKPKLLKRQKALAELDERERVLWAQAEQAAAQAEALRAERIALQGRPL
jgi:hypothetical protein